MKKGFTLIELVVAIAILGIIMIIAIPSINYIQNSNKDTKYIAYEKAINSAGKAYVDAYNEDLFGIDNTGCAVISYDDLKNRGLIEDIQLKNTDCNEENTCVVVRKSKNENYHYETNITCKQSGKKVFEDVNSSCLATNCKLEDGDGPVLKIEDVSEYADNKYYHKGQKPHIKVTISDNGVGLKADQKVNYQWYKDDTAMSEASGILYFKNKNFDLTITRDLALPSGIENTDDTHTYKVVLTGGIEDLDNNKSDLSTWDHSLTYFLGRVYIKIHANNGSLKSPYNSRYSLVSQIVNDKNANPKDIIHTIKYGQSLSADGLINYNNSSYLNLARSGYKVTSGKEWRTSDGTVFNQTTAYAHNKFCDAYEQNCTVTLYVNWVMDKPATPAVTISSPASSKFVTNSSKEKWTSSNIKLSVTTTSPTTIIGNWYTKKGSETYNKVNGGYGLKTISPAEYTCNSGAELEATYYYRVCNKAASDYDDDANCSEISQVIRIDKKKPTYAFKYFGKNPGWGVWKNGCYIHYYEVYEYDTGSGLKTREGKTVNGKKTDIWDAYTSNGAASNSDLLAGCANKITVTLTKLCDILGNCASVPVSRTCNYKSTPCQKS